MAAPTAAGAFRWSAPDRSALEAVRYLCARFPEARLREVPLVRAADLDARADPGGRTRVWLALEALQVTGSFKVRGALVALDAKRSHGAAVAASGGNHGLAVAYAARVLGLAATVCVPPTASPTKLAKIERYGAELVVAASDLPEDVESLARDIARSRRSAYIAQCDDLDVVAGNGASLGFEIVRALGGVPRRLLAPYGGGLATGLSWALRMEARDRPAAVSPVVWGVGGESSWAVPEVGGAGGVGGMLVVTDEQIAMAMAHAYSDMGLVVEGSAAAALAPLLFGLPEGARGGDLVVVLTGRNVDAERLDAVLRRVGEQSPA
ncbi:MAG TPA: pyridoxal-phosphate dependent enzyme [Polyangiaceae bacterium]